MSKVVSPPLVVALAGPRGFCAGVDRAIQIVERALRKFGAPVYVRHEIVHNRFVVESLKAKGAVFVDELDQCPSDRPVIFSAHGVPKGVFKAAADRDMMVVDATCPLVSRVHGQIKGHVANGRQVILIGHAGHPEVVGAMGQVPMDSTILVETRADAETVTPATPQALAYVTQTTLSLDDVADIVAILRHRFPAIVAPRKDTICYATTNRQAAVKTLAPRCDVMVVLGAANSSNSRRLVETAQAAGCPRAFLINRASEIDMSSLTGVHRLGVTAGASAPEVLVDEVVAACRAHFAVSIEHISVADESVTFRLPQILDV